MISTLISRRSLLGFSLLTVLTGACDSDSDAQDGTASAGTSSEDPSAFRLHVSPAITTDSVAMAAVIDGDAVTVYVCGGGASLSTHTRWFFSMPIDAEGDFTGDDQGWTLSGNLADGVLSADLSGPAGEDPAVDFLAVEEGSAAGLYTRSVNGCITGVVTWEDPSKPGGLGSQGAWCNDQDEFGQVIILEPDAFTADGGDVRVEGRDDVPPFEVIPF